MERKTVCFITAFVMLISFIAVGTVGAVSPPKKGGQFPDIQFPVPKDKGHRDYLGLPDSGQFTIPKMKAKLVIIEVFNMY